MQVYKYSDCMSQFAQDHFNFVCSPILIFNSVPFHFQMHCILRKLYGHLIIEDIKMM